MTTTLAIPKQLVHTAILAALSVALACSAPAQDSRPASDQVPESRPGTVLTGRVVGEGRFPVPGARVGLYTFGHDPIRTSTDADGGFVLDISSLGRGWLWVGCVRAFAGALAGEITIEPGRITDWIETSPSGGRYDVGPIALLPTRRVRVKIIDRGAPAAGARVALSRTYSIVDTTTSDEDGVATFEGVVVGHLAWERFFVCSALAANGWEGVAMLVVTKADSIATIELHAPREVSLRVLDAETGEPVAGARARIDSMSRDDLQGCRLAPPTPPTDATGRTTVRIPEADHLSIRVDATDYKLDWIRIGADSRPAPVDVKLTKLPVPRWMLTREGGQPANGTPIAIYSFSIPMQPAVQGVLADRALQIPPGHANDQLGLALAPDGSFADLLENEITFKPPQPLMVELRWDDGTPASGIGLTAGPQALPPPSWGPILTDAAGRARLSLMNRELVWRWGTGGSSWYFDAPKLDPTDGVARTTLNRISEVTLRITLDGARRLPTDFHLDGSEYLVGNPVEDPREATIRFRYWQRTRWWPVDLALHGRGFVSAHVAVSGRPGARIVRDVALHSGATLEIAHSGRGTASLERFDAASGTWTDVHQWSEAQDPDPDDGALSTIKDVLAGAYRLAGESARSRTFEIGGQARVQRVDIDFTKSRWIRGRVEGIEGLPLSVGCVVPLAPGDPAEPDDEFVRMNRVPVDESGNFDFARFGVEPVRLVPWHPSASSASTEPVTAGKWNEQHVLRLGPPRRSIRFNTDFDLPPEFATHATIRVLQLDGDGRPLLRTEAALVEGRFQLAHFRAEESTIVLDSPSELVIARENQAPLVLRLPSRAPLVLDHVHLDQPHVDLGRLSFPTASTLVLKFPESWPRPLPPLAVTVEAREEPRYVRTLTTAGEPEVRLSGLRRGSFRVRVEQREIYAFRFEIDVVADGEHPVEVSVDSPVVK